MPVSISTIISDGPSNQPEEQFNAAVDLIQKLPSDGPVHISNELKLRFYALYKQAKFGACKGQRPAFWDVVGRAKHDAWKSLGELSSADAMSQYVDQIKELAGTITLDEGVETFLKALNKPMVNGHSAHVCNGHADAGEINGASSEPEITDVIRLQKLSSCSQSEDDLFADASEEVSEQHIYVVPSKVRHHDDSDSGTSSLSVVVPLADQPAVSDAIPRRSMEQLQRLQRRSELFAHANSNAAVIARMLSGEPRDATTTTTLATARPLIRQYEDMFEQAWSTIGHLKMKAQRQSQEQKRRLRGIRQAGTVRTAGQTGATGDEQQRGSTSSSSQQPAPPPVADPDPAAVLGQRRSGSRHRRHSSGGSSGSSLEVIEMDPQMKAQRQSQEQKRRLRGIRQAGTVRTAGQTGATGDEQQRGSTSSSSQQPAPPPVADPDPAAVLGQRRSGSRHRRHSSGGSSGSSLEVIEMDPQVSDVLLRMHRQLRSISQQLELMEQVLLAQQHMLRTTLDLVTSENRPAINFGRLSHLFGSLPLRTILFIVLWPFIAHWLLRRLRRRFLGRR